jgi:hypothetical protein
MNFFNQRITLVSLGVGLVFSLAASLLSAATIDDLQFTLINGDTEYSVSAVDPASIAGTLDIPATYNGKVVTHIATSGFGVWDGATDFPDITSVTIPASIQTIGGYAFQNCLLLTTVTFAPGSQLTTIGTHSFYRCEKLTSIVLPDSLTSIGNFAFLNCTSLTSINLPDSLTEIGEAAFIQCYKLTSVVIPDSITSINHRVFQYCRALTSVVIPDSVTSIGYSAFFQCLSLTSIELPAALTSIGSSAFYACYDLSSITFLGAAPTLLEDDVFDETGSDVGGFTITIFDTHEASYDSWRSLYTFDVVPGLVMLAVTTSYTPSNQGLSIITHNEGSAATLTLEHTSNLGDSASWTALSTSEYQKDTDAATGTVTRTMTLEPEANPTGFYRLVSESN